MTKYKQCVLTQGHGVARLLTCGVRSYLNLSQLLPILWAKESKVRSRKHRCNRYFRELVAAADKCEYSQYFEVLFTYYCRYYAPDTFGLALISAFATAAAALVTPCRASSVSGFCTAGTASTISIYFVRW